MKNEGKFIDPTGVELSPGEPELCAGEKHGCCDECDHFLSCFPDWEENEKDMTPKINKEEEKKAEKRLEILLLQSKVDEELEKKENADMNLIDSYFAEIRKLNEELEGPTFKGK